jgi:hypothetical protein
MIELIQTAIPHSKFWIQEIIASLLFIFLISASVSNLRLSVGRRWVAISSCILLYLICMGFAIGIGFLSHTLDNTYHQLKNPNEVAQITKDWGKEMSIEKRNKYSINIARNAFLNGGSFRDYIDLNGNLVVYAPSNEDRQYRASLISSLNQLEQAATLYLWAGIGWLLIPLLGFGIGFTSLNERISRTLSKLKGLISNKPIK